MYTNASFPVENPVADAPNVPSTESSPGIVTAFQVFGWIILVVGLLVGVVSILDSSTYGILAGASLFILGLFLLGFASIINHLFAIWLAVKRR